MNSYLPVVLTSCVGKDGRQPSIPLSRNEWLLVKRRCRVPEDEVMRRPGAKTLSIHQQWLPVIPSEKKLTSIAGLQQSLWYGMEGQVISNNDWQRSPSGYRKIVQELSGRQKSDGSIRRHHREEYEDAPRGSPRIGIIPPILSLLHWRGQRSYSRRCKYQPICRWHRHLGPRRGQDESTGHGAGSYKQDSKLVYII